MSKYHFFVRRYAAFTWDFTEASPQLCKAGDSIPILQMMKLRLRGVRSLPECHTGRECWGEVEPRSVLAPKTVLL